MFHGTFRQLLLRHPGGGASRIAFTHVPLRNIPPKIGHAKNRSPAGKKARHPAAFIGTPDKIKWAQYSPGVEFGPVYGDCDKTGAPCVFQLRFADRRKISAALASCR